VTEPFDPINRPAHYAEGRKYEPIDVITDWQLDFLLGNVVKYVSRAGRKANSTKLQDLEKAQFYLQRAIQDARQVEAQLHLDELASGFRRNHD
jgi:hypothetical protein